MLAALRPQLRPGDEIVVVDDHSTDRTAAVAVASGARVVAAPPLPAGWTGKRAACWTGADGHDRTGRCASSTPTPGWPPGALDRLVSAPWPAAARLVSVQPWHDVPSIGRAAERLFNVVALMGTGVATPTARPRPAPRGRSGRCC